MCGRSDTKTASASPLIAQQAAHATDRFEGRAAAVLDQDRVARDAVGDRVGAGARGLGRPIPLLLPAGHDQARRDARPIELDRVLQPGREDR